MEYALKVTSSLKNRDIIKSVEQQMQVCSAVLASRVSLAVVPVFYFHPTYFRFDPLCSLPHAPASQPPFFFYHRRRLILPHIKGRKTPPIQVTHHHQLASSSRAMFSFTFGSASDDSGSQSSSSSSTTSSTSTPSSTFTRGVSQATTAPHENHFIWSSPFSQQRGFNINTRSDNRERMHVPYIEITGADLGEMPEFVARLLGLSANASTSPSTTTANTSHTSTPAQNGSGESSSGRGSATVFGGVMNVPVTLTPAAAAAAAASWPLRGCPPLSAEDVVSTFTIVEVDDGDGGASASGPTTAAQQANSAAPAEEPECSICLELLKWEASRSSRVPQQQPTAAAKSGGSFTTEETYSPIGNANTKEKPTPLLYNTQAQFFSAQQDAPASHAARAVVREVYCGHRFHEGCILHWIRLGHYTCPLCRAPFLYE